MQDIEFKESIENIERDCDRLYEDFYSAVDRAFNIQMLVYIGSILDGEFCKKFNAELNHDNKVRISVIRKMRNLIVHQSVYEHNKFSMEEQRAFVAMSGSPYGVEDIFVYEESDNGNQLLRDKRIVDEFVSDDGFMFYQQLKEELRAIRENRPKWAMNREIKESNDFHQ